MLNSYSFIVQHMVNPDDADAAIEGLQRYKLDGFAINVEVSVFFRIGFFCGMWHNTKKRTCHTKLTPNGERLEKK